AKFEPNSFGFRPGRSCQDAIRHIYLTVRSFWKFISKNWKFSFEEQRTSNGVSISLRTTARLIDKRPGKTIGTGSVSCNSGLRSAFMPLFESRRPHGARSHGPESLKPLPELDGS